MSRYFTVLIFTFRQVGGIIILGLMVSSIHNFAQELGSSHVVRSHTEKQRSHTLRRTATTNEEFHELEARLMAKFHRKHRPPISAPLEPTKRAIDFDIEKGQAPADHERHHHKHPKNPVAAGMMQLRRIGSRKPKILMMREEKDRFDAMRKIQHDTHKFKRYSALLMSVLACKIHSSRPQF